MNARYAPTLAMAAALLAGLAAPSPAAAYESSRCGPMCHAPAGIVHEGMVTAAGPRAGTIHDMKLRLGVGREQDAAWEKFKNAMFDRMLAAFDAEKVAYVNLTTPPSAFNPENMEPTLSPEMIAKWRDVDRTFKTLQVALDADRKRINDLLHELCKEAR